MKIALALLTFFTLVGLAACKDGYPTVPEVRTFIDQNIKPGDPESKILEFFKRSGWAFDYDSFSQRYQSVYPKTKRYITGTKGEISIYIYLNPDRSFKRAEVEEVFTAI